MSDRPPCIEAKLVECNMCFGTARMLKTERVLGGFIRMSVSLCGVCDGLGYVTLARKSVCTDCKDRPCGVPSEPAGARSASEGPT